jgi:poly [ADP-ribose] polymerase
MDAIERESKEFNALVEYARNTHGATHNSFTVNVLNAFRVSRSVAIFKKLEAPS